MEKYIINKDLYFEAWSWQRSGRWGHKARAVYQNRVTEEVSITYQNRTWEAYKFQSVMEKLIDHLDAVNYVPLADRIEASKVIKKGDQREMKGLQKIGALAMLGGIIGGNTTKQRIIASIPGVIMPDGFEELGEEEKSRRLDGAINILTK